MSRKIGAHVSIAGGLDKSPKRAAEIGANCLQIFSGSPRVWAKPNLAARAVDKFFAKQDEFDAEPVFTHAIYLINLASDKASLVEKSSWALKYDLEFDALVKGSGVVVHLGSHQGRGWEASREQLVKAIKEILADSPTNSQLLIENSAGQKGKVCSNLEEIRWLLDQVGSPRLGWCFDTCHAFAAGYALGLDQMGPDKEKMQKPKKERNQRQGSAVEEISRLDLWPSLKLIHVNDSEGEFGSGRDKHANFGEGKISPNDLEHFLNHKLVKELPLITEAPGFDGNGPDEENIELLKKLAHV